MGIKVRDARGKRAGGQERGANVKQEVLQDSYFCAMREETWDHFGGTEVVTVRTDVISSRSLPWEFVKNGQDIPAVCEGESKRLRDA